MLPPPRVLAVAGRRAARLQEVVWVVYEDGEGYDTATDYDLRTHWGAGACIVAAVEPDGTVTADGGGNPNHA